jgi:16S rRNA (adenine1518-N6/adenine1519-N6)-dimethyltransferase
MKRNHREALGCDERLFRRIVKGTFLHRRKMLRVTLRGIMAQIDATTGCSAPHDAFLSAPGLTRRPETLSVDEFVGLTNAVARECALDEAQEKQ